MSVALRKARGAWPSIAAEKGITLPESVLQSLIRASSGGRERAAPNPDRDMRVGVFLAMIGFSIALVGLGLMIAFGKDGGPPGIMIAALGAIPVCIGVGYIGAARMGERARKSGIE